MQSHAKPQNTPTAPLLENKLHDLVGGGKESRGPTDQLNKHDMGKRSYTDTTRIHF